MKELLTRLPLPSVIGGAFALLWLISDFSTRFISEQQSRSQESSYKLTDISIPKLSEQQVSSIIELFSPYRIPTEEAADKDKVADATSVMSKEAQAGQSGELSELFVDDNKLMLKGVIGNQDSNNRVALIQVTNSTNNESKLERFSQPGKVYGYDLTILTNTKVKLVRVAGEQEQVIVLTLFTPKVNAAQEI